MWWVIHHSICSIKRSLRYLLWLSREFIVCLIVMSKAFLKLNTNDCDTLNPLCSRSSLHMRCVSDKFICECNQLHRYILCVVVVIVCNEHWRQGIQIEMTCNSKLFSLLPLSVPTPSELYTYTLPRTVLQWLSFRNSTLNAWYLLFMWANSEWW